MGSGSGSVSVGGARGKGMEMRTPGLAMGVVDAMSRMRMSAGRLIVVISIGIVVNV